MSACDDGHTTQPCPGCGTCIRWQTSYGTTPKTAGWVEHDGSAHHCRAASNVAALVDAAREALNGMPGGADESPCPTGLTTRAKCCQCRRVDALRAALGALNAARGKPS